MTTGFTLIIKRVYVNLHHLKYLEIQIFKCPLSGLRQFLATENPLKMMKNVSP